MGPPFNFFDILQQIGCLKIKGTFFQFFGIVRLFFENLVFLQRVPPATATKILTISKGSPITEPGARASEARRATRSIYLVFRFSSAVN